MGTNAGYISLREMSYRDGVPVSVLRRYCLGGFVRTRREVRYVGPVLRKSIDFVVMEGKVFILGEIQIIRGEIKRCSVETV